MCMEPPKAEAGESIFKAVMVLSMFDLIHEGPPMKNRPITKNSHRDGKDTRGDGVSDVVVAVHGSGGVLHLSGGSLCKVYTYLITMRYTCN